MIKILIDGPSASVKANGDMPTIISEVAYGIKILYDKFEERGRGDEFAEVMTQAVEFVFKDDDSFEEAFEIALDDVASRAAEDEDIFDDIINKLHSEEAKNEFAKAVLMKMREKK